MAQRYQSFVVQAPGFYGLNSQQSSLDLDSGWALTADNCVIDRYGRIGARKGFVDYTAYLAALGTANVGAMASFVASNGTMYTVVAGNNKLFTESSGVLTEITYGGGGSAPTITADDWSFVSLNGVLFGFQAGHDPIAFDPATSTTTWRRNSEMTGATGTPPQGNFAIVAFGRIWVAEAGTDRSIIYFCDLLAGHKWTAGTSGYIDLDNVWPQGMDIVTGMASHGNQLFLFGKNSIVIYDGADDPTTMKSNSTTDQLYGVGCINHRTVWDTGTDVVFLSYTGLRSLGRTIQEKSVPMNDLSKNVRDELMIDVQFETLANIRAVYSPIDGLYLLYLPASKVIYCFDTRKQLQDGAWRVTKWRGLAPTSMAILNHTKLVFGRAGYLQKYDGYTDNGTAYTLRYFTNHTDFGEPMVESIVKRLTLILVGGSNQSVSAFWGFDFSNNYRSEVLSIPLEGSAEFNVAQYNIDEFSGGSTLNQLTAHPGGSGKVVQMGFEAEINGAALSLQKLELVTKNGKAT